MTSSAPRRVGLSLPREHGAWVMLAAAAAAGWAVSTPLRLLPALLVLCLLSGAFVGQESLRQWERAQRQGAQPVPVALWGLGLLSLASAAVLAWLAPSPTLWVGLAGGAALYGLQRWLAPRGRADVGLQLVAVAGFALALPLAAASGTLRPSAAWAGWAVTFGFYAAAVCQVRMLLTAPRRLQAGEGRLSQATVRTATFATALAVAVPLLAGAWLPWRQPLLALALLPALARLAAGWRWLAAPPPLKRVGLWETAWTLWFALALAAWLRS